MHSSRNGAHKITRSPGFPCLCLFKPPNGASLLYFLRPWSIFWGQRRQGTQELTTHIHWVWECSCPQWWIPYLMLGLLAFFLRTKTCLIYQCSCHPQSLPSPPLVPLVAENSLALPSILVPPETSVLTFKPTAINEVRLWCSPTRCLPWPSSGSQGYQPGHQPTAFAVTHQGLFLAPFLLQGWPILIMASQFW